MIKNNFYPIINIVLRCGTRVLKNQEQIYIDFINKIIKTYPNAYIYFDGFVKNYLNKNISFNKSNTNILLMEYNKLVDNIITNITTKNYKSLIGLNSFEIINYLNIADIGIYTTGSGCIISGWICNIPGITFGISNNKIYEKMDKIIKENMTKIDYIEDIQYINENEYILKFDLLDKFIEFKNKNII